MTGGARRAAVLGVLALAAAGPAWAQAPAPEPAPAGQPPEPALGWPTAQMRDYTSEVLKALQEAMVQEADRVGAARLAARKLAIQVFGLAEAAQEALGPHWEARTPAEREEFIQLFADLLEATYIAQLDKQRGLRIRYVGESIDGERAQVRARLSTRKGDEAMLEARLSRREGRWLIYDVVFEGVSLMGNFRSQFESVIRKSSYASLNVQLKAKRAASASGNLHPWAIPLNSLSRNAMATRWCSKISRAHSATMNRPSNGLTTSIWRDNRWRALPFPFPAAGPSPM